jgi:hypothetical protein
MRDAICSGGMDWVWNDELNTIWGQNVATAHVKIIPL